MKALKLPFVSEASENALHLLGCRFNFHEQRFASFLANRNITNNLQKDFLLTVTDLVEDALDFILSGVLDYSSSLIVSW